MSRFEYHPKMCFEKQTSEDYSSEHERNPRYVNIYKFQIILFYIFLKTKNIIYSNYNLFDLFRLLK